MTTSWHAKSTLTTNGKGSCIKDQRYSSWDSRILGWYQLVDLFMWLMKYISSSCVTEISQPGGTGCSICSTMFWLCCGGSACCCCCWGTSADSVCTTWAAEPGCGLAAAKCGLGDLFHCAAAEAGCVCCCCCCCCCPDCWLQTNDMSTSSSTESEVKHFSTDHGPHNSLLRNEAEPPAG